MKKLKPILSFILVITLVALLTTGCNQQESKNVNKTKELKKVTVSEVTHSVFYAPQYAAISQGFFEEEGLDIELINGGGADKVMTAVVSGQVDIGFSGCEQTVYVYNEGKENYVITFAQLTNKDGSFLVGREPDPNFTFDKLIGKEVIGGRKGGMPEMTFEYVLKQQGIDPQKDVHIDTSIQFDSMAAAFKSGQGDYVTLFEPVATQIEKDGSGYVVASIGEASGDVAYTAYNASKNFIEKNPNVIQKFTNAIYKGQRWVEQADYEEIAKAIHEFFPEMKFEDLVKVVQRYKDQDSWAKTPVMSKESFEHMQNIIEDAGVIEKRAPYEKLVTTEFAEKAVQEIK
ncbi:ABC transporter substrate-binding protein [Garciella nitratireducens]|uniref:ABC transporter substrate-binding protein n=1 Tax=Garciella nitratireducens TaxID=218205 RepID=UPI000DEA7D5F|nr:ABC transporter substrate-binding protein [Garciella nitratireducens]RBP46918.1 NitT/TauT family transport system substrate-binding protein [Garciella nitratireducens]